MNRDQRYYRALHWAMRRARAMPGVRFTAAIDNERLSCTADHHGHTALTWQYYEAAKKEARK